MNKGQTIIWEDGKRITPFEKQWGMSVADIAHIEQTTPEAVRMRIKRFGTPYQRKAKPTRAEIIHGKTVWQLACELGTTHISMHKLIADGRDPYKHHHNRGRNYGGKQYIQLNPAKEGWLMPQHPDYLTWRDNYEV